MEIETINGKRISTKVDGVTFTMTAKDFDGYLWEVAVSTNRMFGNNTWEASSRSAIYEDYELKRFFWSEVANYLEDQVFFEIEEVPIEIENY